MGSQVSRQLEDRPAPNRSDLVAGVWRGWGEVPWARTLLGGEGHPAVVSRTGLPWAPGQGDQGGGESRWPWTGDVVGKVPDLHVEMEPLIDVSVRWFPGPVPVPSLATVVWDVGARCVLGPLSPSACAHLAEPWAGLEVESLPCPTHPLEGSSPPAFLATLCYLLCPRPTAPEPRCPQET